MHYGVGGTPFWVAVGDVDSVNGPDLVVANSSSGDVSVLLNNGDGTFATDIRYGAGDGAQSVALADLDGDRDLDLTVAFTFSDQYDFRIEYERLNDLNDDFVAGGSSITSFSFGGSIYFD